MVRSRRAGGSERFAELSARDDLERLLAHVLSALSPKWSAIYRLEATELSLAFAVDGVDVPGALDTSLLREILDARKPIDLSENRMSEPGRAALAKLGAEVATPLFSATRTVGLVLIGPRVSRTPYDAWDHRLIHTTAKTAAVAIHNALSSRLAITDPLTGLYNRLFFDEGIRRALSEAHRFDEYVGLLLLDMNDFKQINDVHGHLAGDAVLRDAAERFRASARAYDLVARTGGDEFAIIVPRVQGPDSLKALAERIKSSVALARLAFNGEELRYTVSIGFAAMKSQGTTPAALVEAADTVLYDEKRARKALVAR